MLVIEDCFCFINIDVCSIYINEYVEIMFFFLLLYFINKLFNMKKIGVLECFLFLILLCKEI